MLTGYAPDPVLNALQVWGVLFSPRKLRNGSGKRYYFLEQEKEAQGRQAQGHTASQGVTGLGQPARQWDSRTPRDRLHGSWREGPLGAERKALSPERAEMAPLVQVGSQASCKPPTSSRGQRPLSPVPFSLPEAPIRASPRRAGERPPPPQSGPPLPRCAAGPSAVTLWPAGFCGLGFRSVKWGAAGIPPRDHQRG